MATRRSSAPGLAVADAAGAARWRRRRALNTWGWRAFLGARGADAVRAARDPRAVLVQRLEHPRVPARGRSRRSGTRQGARPTPCCARRSRTPSRWRSSSRRSASCSARSPRSGSRGSGSAGAGVIGGLVGAPLVLPWLIIGIAALMGYARAEHRSQPEDRDRDADRLHVPARDGDRGGAALPVPAGAGGGGDRPRVLAAAGAAAHHPAAHRPGARGGRRSSRSRGRSTTTRSARSRSGSSRRSRSGCTRTCATPITPRS